MIWKRRTQPHQHQLSAQLMQLIVESHVEGIERQEAASAQWGLGSAERWSADLATGTLQFEFADHVLRGEVALLGSYAIESGTWMWGWGNPSVPATVAKASAAVQALSAEPGLELLAEPSIMVPAELATDLADVAVTVAGLNGWYRSPSPRQHVYLGFSNFETLPR